MGSEWQILKIDEIKAPTDRSIAIGPFGSRMKSGLYVESGVPVIRGSNISDTQGFSGEFVSVSEETANQLSHCNVFAGDLVFPHRGSIGLVGIVPIHSKLRYVLSTSLMKLSCDRSVVDPLFVFYFFRSNAGQHSLLKYASTVGTPGIGQPLRSLRAIEIPVPPLSEQKAIARILGTLDDKIELNRQMSVTLEAMARALFKSWFVDFDPVRAKAEGRDPGLPKNLIRLLPSRLVESEIGQIPKDWKVASLSDHFTAVKGLSYKGRGLTDSGTPLHNLNSIYEGGGYKFEGIKFYSGDYAERHIVQPGDVLVANTEQGHDRLLIGYSAIVPSSFGKMGLASHHLFIVRPRPTSWLTPIFLSHLLNSHAMHGTVSGYSNGTTVNMLPVDGIQMPKICIPPPPFVEAFSRLGAFVEQRKAELVEESKTLSTLRETLLPRLISGELPIKNPSSFLKGNP